MGIYFGEGIYGIKCVDMITKDVLLEIIKETKYLGKEINEILQSVNKFSNPFDIYFYKSYNTSYELNSKAAFMWVKTNFALENKSV